MNTNNNFFGTVAVKLADQQSSIGCWVMLKAAYAGSIDAIVSPVDDATNSLLINSPTGWLHLTPFGAARSTEGTVMIWLDGFCDAYVRLAVDSVSGDGMNGKSHI